MKTIYSHQGKIFLKQMRYIFPWLLAINHFGGTWYDIDKNMKHPNSPQTAPYSGVKADFQLRLRHNSVWLYLLVRCIIF